jgi:hypothetical protein
VVGEMARRAFAMAANDMPVEDLRRNRGAHVGIGSAFLRGAKPDMRAPAY